MKDSLVRKIIHIDMDAFYASVEQRDQPSTQGKPVVVGGNWQNRGVVCSASYEARKFGIRSAMSTAQAHRLCPHAIFIPPRFEKYTEASRKMRAIFRSVTPLVEPLALDEAYLDVTENRMGLKRASEVALWIKNEIFKQTSLTASAGVGPNKFIAKLASDFKKPNGLVVVAPERVFQFIENLPVGKFWGVGPATAKKLQEKGIWSAADIRKMSPEELASIVGSYGRFLSDLAWGRDEREVDPSFDPKSKGTETTFKKDVVDPEYLLNCLREQATEVSGDLKKIERMARTVHLKLKYSDFTSITRSKTFSHPTQDYELIKKVASELLFMNTGVGERAVRLIGISVGNFIKLDAPIQLWFQFPESDISSANNPMDLPFSRIKSSPD